MYDKTRDSHRAIYERAKDEQDAIAWLVSEVYMARMKYEQASNEVLRLQAQLKELIHG